jgi:hypothetical protein
MSKMGSHDPFGHLKHKLWPKERSGVKLPIWFPTIKSQESFRFPCVQVTCHIMFKSCWRGLQLGFRPHFNKRSTCKVMAPQSCKSPSCGSFGTPYLGVSGQNDIWVLVLWLDTEYTIRGKVVASPKSGPWWVLWVQVCPWFVCGPKCSDYALINLLFGLCKSVWIIELLVNLLSPHPRAPSHPSTPKVLRTREHALTPFPFNVFTFGLVVESIKELGGVSSNLGCKTWFENKGMVVSMNAL